MSCPGQPRTCVVLADFVARAIGSGQLRPHDPARMAAQMWTAVLGYVMLELAGLHLPPDNPVEDVMKPLLATLLAGLSADDTRGHSPPAPGEAHDRHR